MKKLISALLVCCMVLLMFPVSAAEEATAQPTIEEILNEYYQRVSEAQSAGDKGGASTWSRGGSNSKTPEQETVETLTDAGYEAYHVTADNYSNLEASLNIDFAEMGLDPDGSYIVVINGDVSQGPAGRSIGGSGIVQNPGDTGGGSGIRHTYNGVTYTMRSVTIALGSDPALKDRLVGDIRDTAGSDDYCSYLASWLIAAADYGVTASGAYSLWDGYSSDASYSLLENNRPTVYADIHWTLRYIQVWDALHNRWVTSQCSSYAVVTNAHVMGGIRNNTTNEIVDLSSGSKTATIYSTYYNNYGRYDIAAEAYIRSVADNETYVYRDHAEVGIYFFNDDGECINADGSPLFICQETPRALYPYYDYEN